jgi:hypothetical protein
VDDEGRTEVRKRIPGRTGMKDNGKKMEKKRGGVNKKFWKEVIA